MGIPIFRITDGTTTINLIATQTGDSGFYLQEFVPAIAGYRDGGSFQTSPFRDGRRVTDTKYENIIDTMVLAARGESQDILARQLQDMRRLLIKAKNYWISPAVSTPVWIEAKAESETNTRYSIIHLGEILSDGNPFSQPFLQSDCAAVYSELELIIEHGHWTDSQPGSPTAIALGNRYTADGARTIIAVPETNLDDVENYFIESTSDTSADNIYATIGGGASPTSYYGAGIRFRNVQIDQGATITSAIVRLVSYFNYSLNTVNVHLTVEDSSTPDIFDTGDPNNFRSGFATTSPIEWNAIGAWTDGGEYDSPDISTAIQALVNRSDWVSGNDIKVWITDNSSSQSATRVFSTFNNTTDMPPRLIITTDEPVTVALGNVDDTGALETSTSQKVYIANHRCEANVTHIFSWDESAAQFGNNVQAMDPATEIMYLFPSGGVGASDACYFGIALDDANGGIIVNLVFDINLRTPTGLPIRWEYWSGSSWLYASAPFVVHDNTEGWAGGGAFTESGVNSVAFYFRVGTAWASSTINGVEAFWLRARAQATTGGDTIVQQNRHVYSVTRPYIEIQSTELGGDLPADIFLEILQEADYLGPADYPSLYVDRMIIASRTMSRGANFTPVINWSETNNPSGITVVEENADGSHGFVTESPKAPIMSATGQMISMAASTVQEMFSITIDSTLSGHYQGKFRIFSRYAASGISEITGFESYIKITTGSGGVAVGDPVYVNKDTTSILTGPYLLDYGLFNIDLNDSVADTIKISLYAAVTSAATVFMPDIWLIPVDEWAIDAFDTAHTDNSRISDDRSLVIDNASSRDQVVYVKDASDQLVATYVSVSNSLANLQPNEKVRIYFFSMLYGSSEYFVNFGLLSAKLYAVQKYLSLRGDR